MLMSTDELAILFLFPFFDFLGYLAAGPADSQKQHINELVFILMNRAMNELGMVDR